MEHWLGKLGLTAYRLRKWIVAVWIIAVLGLAVFAVQLPGVLKGNGFTMKGSFQEVNQLLKDRFKVYDTTVLLLFEQSVDGDYSKFEAQIRQTMDRLLALPLQGLATATGPFEGKGVSASDKMMKDGVAYAALGFDLEAKHMKDNLSSIQDAVNGLKKEGIPVKLTGAPIIENDLNTASQEDLTRAEMIGLPVALIVLLLAFGGLIAAGLPLIVGLISVVCTMGVLYFFGLQMDLSVFLLNVIVMLGLALGIDFALLFVNRFRQELAQHSVEVATRISVQTAGESIIFSGLCVFIGLAGMLFIQVDIFKVIALGGMTVVLFSILSALTLLPALLSLLGHRINRFMVLRNRTRTSVSSPDGIWLRFSRNVMKRPVLMALSAFLLLLAAMIPIRNMDLRVPDTTSLPEHYESRIAYNLYEETFIASHHASIVVLAQAPESYSQQDALQRLYQLQQKLQKDPYVEQVESIFTLAGGVNAEQWQAMMDSPAAVQQLAPIKEAMLSDNLALLRVQLKGDNFAKATKKWVKSWEREDNGLQLKIGGYAKFNQEIFDEISTKAVYSLALIFGATYLVLLLAFRSVLIPLKAILMNALSLCATFGLLVWIFQDGLLGMEPSSIALFIPIFIFSIVFGLSTDYEVFLISRIQEIYRQTQDNDQATLEGLALTSKIITSAAAIMIVITGAFAFTGVMPIKQLGVGIALAIFIDATIVRMVLVPSMMKLLGKWNWWAPRFIQGRKMRDEGRAD
ncbi:MMPL family transporter [Paenibacillus sp. GCM10012307]|uniref:MMPL family transporter n=1 Tax=Paenibacillus roseus TaxID=2798579 RepID=A0A934J5J2_9BACL|nr:MMPL family transporter [Paenibacillus roseus]MBJ6361953.1 MMPL family transporter [Paenibacillus roseus]